MANDDTMGTETPTPKAFTLYSSYWETCKLLSPNQRHTLLDSMCAYVFDNAVPDFSNDPMLNISWVNIAPTLDASIKGSIDGQRGGRPRKTKGATNRGKKGKSDGGETTQKSTLSSDTPLDSSTRDYPSTTLNSASSHGEGGGYGSTRNIEFAETDIPF